MIKPTLPLNSEAVLAAAARYSYAPDAVIEAMIPGVEARGFLTREEFLFVGTWKSPRIRSRLESNSAVHIEEATRVALTTRAEELRTGVLMTLTGVAYPVASVFLHWFHQEPYPILDFRALEALGIPMPRQYTECFWREYVAAWRAALTATGVDKRTLDRALWQWSKEHPDPGSGASSD